MNEKRFLEEGFNEFLQELVDGKNLKEDKDYGIAKKAIDDGYDSLSEKQKYVLKDAISYYLYDTCKGCGNDITWSEMYFAEGTDGYCPACHHRLNKND